MIQSFYLKDYLTFTQAHMEFDAGLIVFTGPSGAGKSILMQAILGTLGKAEVKASLSEIRFENFAYDAAVFDVQKGDDLILKQIKKEKVRFFVNNQNASKKIIQQITKDSVAHLHHKDHSDFDAVKLIAYLDSIANQKNAQHSAVLKEYKESYEKLSSMQKELDKLIQDEKNLEDLKEFTQFEIEKIEKIDPKIDEYEELSQIKKQLSQKDKIEDAINNAKALFTIAPQVSTALHTLDVNSAFFDDCINEVNHIFESSQDFLDGLEGVDIESTLDRIEQLSKLQKRFGSIQEALEYKKQKALELESYENISFEKAILEKNITKRTLNLQHQAKQITQQRQDAIQKAHERINYYLQFLYLNNAQLNLTTTQLNSIGENSIEFELNGVSLDTISSGEFNRLRLALLASISEINLAHDGGVLFLDEIDANLSGKESQSIAQVLLQLSKFYQIFAISHQPQLTAIAHNHFLVEKHDNQSSIKKLTKDERIDEISRMISGEDITHDAKQFAANLINQV
ncbi:MAG: AAA family ATPase [Campylobacterota bacterium]|nr:AAA family ATPase [Campylobacterota bacterium]